MVGGAVARLTANSEPQAGERLCIWGRAEWLRGSRRMNSRLKLRRPLKGKTLRVLETLRVLMCGHPAAASIMSFSIVRLSLLPFRPAHVIITIPHTAKYNSESKG